jgi:uncharacterized membrane protein
MADKKPVNVNWQTLFILIPIIDLWATYRIEKFRVYFLVFWVGAGIVETVVLWTVMGESYWADEGMYFLNDLTGLSIQIPMMVVHAGISVYFIRVWSKEWNSKLSSVSSEKKDTTVYVRSEDSSIELLKKRYAMGEISKEEFEKKKKDLENS